ncbi:LOW QUALITY PROTEIN: hypothetical protein HZS_5113 [Henneguya salminicola]|nr:LOW QUALITY PROTEIN: hypothetical protein HZS_5113 [Henneguya salminicola]
MDRAVLANDAMLKGSSAKIVDLHGSCRHVIELLGKDDKLEFYSNNIVFRPKLKISILLWIKPTDYDANIDSSPLIIITGMHPDPFTSYIRLDRYMNGSISSQHRNENGEYVYNISTESKINEWTHIAFTYTFSDSDKGESRIYINGTLKYRASGSGYISKDWDGYAAIGNDNDGRYFIGYFDDIMIFDRVLSPFEINEKFQECNFDKYYTGENIKSDHGVIMSPTYPNMYTAPIKAHWIIRSSIDQYIEISIDELKLGSEQSCERSNLIVRELISGYLIERLCGGIKEGKDIISNSSAIILNLVANLRELNTKFEIKSISKRTKVNFEHVDCIKNAKLETDYEKYFSEDVIDIGHYRNPHDCIYA